MDLRRRSTITRQSLPLSTDYYSSVSPHEDSTSRGTCSNTTNQDGNRSHSNSSSSPTTNASTITTAPTTTAVTLTRPFQRSLSNPYQHINSNSQITYSNNINKGGGFVSNRSSSFYRRHLMFPLGMLLAVAPWIYHSSINWRIRSLKSSIVIIQRESKKLHDHLEHYSDRYRQQKQKILSLEHTNSELLKTLAAAGEEEGDVDALEESNYYLEAEQNENLYIERINTLEEAIQNRSKRHAAEKYGEGRYLINVTLTEASLSSPSSPLPYNRQQQDSMKQNDDSAGQRWFLIETAPINLMPHAVDHFIRMVEVQLWDGLSFSAGISLGGSHSNLIHSTTVSAHTNQYLQHYYEDHSKNGNHQTTLAFAEHSVEYPIEKYSVVFEGRPGGPNFYIHMGGGNKDNNNDKEDQKITYSKMDLHHSHHHHSEACFGKVIQGREILDRFLELAQSSAKHPPALARGNRPRLLGIESIRMVSPSSTPSSTTTSTI